MKDDSRNNIVIDKPYQYAVSGFVVVSVLLIVNGLLLAGVLLPDLVGFKLVLTTRGLVVIAVSQLALLVLIWIVALRRTHRVAGPIAVFRQAMQQMEQGDLTPRLALRKNDEFQELADIMNSAIAAMRDRLLCVEQKVTSMESAGNSMDLEFAREDIREILQEFTLVEGETDKAS